ncbi:hypothetical protein B0I27_101251 [Arcticibacter pallidicorallinus]|uniref:Uncharacterized protein n=1 Tax=Arcticibacter pallidicorallinus TaxID=1259464 RepID=A0A2T0UBK9_9SPHI|nr:DUF6266 family protein [Arcticibacter pallidicorallinus]PRY55282.1 hypothetical protein B0I27_101251 [Arcticibacter pallidicorallinus]
MGILKHGLFGPLSGKVGNTVGSSWRGIHYVRSLSKKTQKEPSAKQLAARARFAAVNKFLLPLKDVIERGYSNQDLRRATALNLAVKENYATLTGTDEHPGPDYSKLVLSKDKMVCRPLGCKIAAGTPGRVKISWQGGDFLGDRVYDRATVVISCPEKEEVIVSMDQFFRGDQLADLEIPSGWLNVTIYGYAFMTDYLGRNSRTAFAGSLEV